MQVTKKQLEEKIKHLEAVIAAAGIEEVEPTMMDNLRELEMDTLVAVSELITDCEKKTGRRLDGSDVIPPEARVRRDVESANMVDKFINGDNHLKDTLVALTKHVRKNYQFKNADNFIGWFSNIVNRNW